MPGSKIESKGMGEMRKHYNGFLQRKPHADAYARPRAEGNVNEPVDAVTIAAEESVGIEVVGALPQSVVAMKKKWGNCHDRTGANAFSGDFVRIDRSSGQHGRRRIERVAPPPVPPSLGAYVRPACP